MKDHLSKEQYVDGQELLLHARLLLAQENYDFVYCATQDLFYWIEELNLDNKIEFKQEDLTDNEIN